MKDIFITVLYIGLLIIFPIALIVKYGNKYIVFEDDYIDVSE